MLVSRPKVERLLSQMQGHLFEHEGKRFKLVSFEFVGSDVKVHTTERMYYQPWSEMYSIIVNEFATADGANVTLESTSTKPEPNSLSKENTTQIEPMSTAKNASLPSTQTKSRVATTETNSPSSVPAVPVPQVETVKVFPKLTQILLENIDAVRNDKGYCEQAQQVSLSARMIVDIAKAEIEALQVTQGV